MKILLAACLATALVAVALAEPQQSSAQCQEIRTILERIGDMRIVDGKRVYSGGELDEIRRSLAEPQFELNVIRAVLAADAGVRDGNYVSARVMAAEAITIREGRALTPWLKSAIETGPAGNRAGAVAAELNQRAALLERRVTELKDEENSKVRAINLFHDQLTNLNCPNAERKRPDVTGGGGGNPPGGNVRPPANENNRAGQAGIVPQWWIGDWSHDFGTMTLASNADAMGIADILTKKNAWGPELTCADGARAFRGELTWQGSSFGFERFSAVVVACATGNMLEGKFSNVSQLSAADAARGRIRSGYFKARMNVSGEKRFFQGTVSRWNQVSQADFSGSSFWSGRKQ